MRVLHLLLFLALAAQGAAAQGLYLPGETGGLGVTAGYLGASGGGELGLRAGFAAARHFDIGVDARRVTRTVDDPTSGNEERQARLAVALYVGGTIAPAGWDGPRIRIGGSFERLGGWDEGRGGGEATAVGIDLTAAMAFGQPLFIQPIAGAARQIEIADRSSSIALFAGLGVGYRTAERRTLLFEPALSYDGRAERTSLGARLTVAFPF
jgi:hypothetical protein